MNVHSICQFVWVLSWVTLGCVIRTSCLSSCGMFPLQNVSEAMYVRDAATVIGNYGVLFEYLLLKQCDMLVNGEMWVMSVGVVVAWHA
jgi:hypothetical protein